MRIQHTILSSPFAGGCSFRPFSPSQLHAALTAVRKATAMPTITAAQPTAKAPHPSQSAALPNSQNNSSNSDSLVKYYFIFVALILCFAGLCTFFMLRRRRKMRTQWAMRQSASDRELQQMRNAAWNAWSPERRRYWGPREDDAASGAEGLDENGHAPPPYRPKTSSGDSESNGPTMPGHALSRDEVGLKLPDYVEIVMRHDGSGHPGSGDGGTLFF